MSKAKNITIGGNYAISGIKSLKINNKLTMIIAVVISEKVCLQIVILGTLVKRLTSTCKRKSQVAYSCNKCCQKSYSSRLSLVYAKTE